MAGVVRLGDGFIEEDHRALTIRPCHWRMGLTKFKGGEIEDNSKKIREIKCRTKFATAIRFVSFARGYPVPLVSASLFL